MSDPSRKEPSSEAVSDILGYIVFIIVISVCMGVFVGGIHSAVFTGLLGAFVGFVAFGKTASNIVQRSWGWARLRSFQRWWRSTHLRSFQGSQRSARVSTAPPITKPITKRPLRWVGVLLPGEEGGAWLAEVTSCLAEARDKTERRRYLRSYRRAMPELIWTSWSEHLSAAGRRKLP